MTSGHRFQSGQKLTGLSAREDEQKLVGVHGGGLDQTGGAGRGQKGAV